MCKLSVGFFPPLLDISPFACGLKVKFLYMSSEAMPLTFFSAGCVLLLRVISQYYCIASGNSISKSIFPPNFLFLYLWINDWELIFVTKLSKLMINKSSSLITSFICQLLSSICCKVLWAVLGKGKILTEGSVSGKERTNNVETNWKMWRTCLRY